MTSITMTSMDPVLKELYRYSRIVELAYTDNPFLASLNKFEEFVGKKMIIPIRYGRPKGRSGTFSYCQTYASPSSFESFEIKLAQDYGVATIDGKTADLSEGDKAGFIDAVSSEVDGIMMEVARNLSRRLFRSETGSLGRVGSTSGASNPTYIILATPSDITNFEVGMVLECSATGSGDGGQTYANGGSTYVEAITAIDRVNGKITGADFGDLVDGTTSPAAGDYLYCTGDALNGGTAISAAGTAGTITGLQDWLLTASSATAFFGVDRSADSRLWGNYYDGASDSREEALINGQSIAGVEGGTVDKYWLNPVDYRSLVKELGAKVHYENIQAVSGQGPVANIGFQALVIQGDKGTIKVMADPNCQAGTAWGLDSKTWQLNSAGQAPKILMRDGLRIMRQATSDGYEVRCGYYGQLSCDAPGHNVRVAMPS